jgi:hypothetical protein
MDDKDETDKRYWYVRHNDCISGPYSGGLIKRQVLLGKIGKDDELSHDQQGWKRLTQLPDLVPPVMNADPDDPVAMQRLIAARRWADDREYAHPGVQLTGENSTIRTTNGDEQATHHNIIVNKLENKKRERRYNNFYAVLLLVMLMVAFGYFFSNTSPVKDVPIDCFTPPAPGVEWSNCFMQGVSLAGVNLEGAKMMNANFIGVDFNHSNMSRSELSYSSMIMVNAISADFESATLIGVNFRGADLSQANLRNADLSYANLLSTNITGADFTGAKLDNTRWVDGKICAAGSIARCK